MLRRHWFGILAVLVASAFLAGTLLFYWLFPPHPSWELVSDPWVQPPPDHDSSKWIEVPQSDFRRVPLDRVERAVRLLEEVPVVELGEEDLDVFVPLPPPNPEGRRPYLVRGVIGMGWDGKPLGTGGFGVRQ